MSPTAWCRWKCARTPGSCRMRAEEQASTGAGEQGGKGAGAHKGVEAQHPTSTIDHRPSTIPCPQRRLEWFIAGTEPTEVDGAHLRVLIDTRTGQPADETTPPHTRRTADDLAAPVRIPGLGPRQRYPATCRACEQPGVRGRRIRRSGARSQESAIKNQKSQIANLQLTSPDPNRTYRISPGLPLSAQAIPVTALPASGLEGEIVLWVDGAPFAAAPVRTAPPGGHW